MRSLSAYSEGKEGSDSDSRGNEGSGSVENDGLSRPGTGGDNGVSLVVGSRGVQEDVLHHGHRVSSSETEINLVEFFKGGGLSGQLSLASSGGVTGEESSALPGSSETGLVFSFKQSRVGTNKSEIGLGLSVFGVKEIEVHVRVSFGVLRVLGIHTGSTVLLLEDAKTTTSEMSSSVSEGVREDHSVTV